MDRDGAGMEAPSDPPQRRPPPRPLLIAGLALVTALVVVIAVLAFRLGSATATAAAGSASPAPSATATPTVQDIYETVGPSVVVIRTPADLGTGVVASEDGTILTANHVVADGGAIEVTFAGGETADAEVASADPERDVATLRLTSAPGGTIVPAVLGGGVEVGAPVVAIGNPLGLAYSVSSGVVSGLDRQGRTADGDFSGLIQFDASVNPGSSGGPLLDGTGTVVGIVVSIADPGNDEAFAGIAFAVPIGAALGGGGEGEGPGDGPRI